MGHPRNRLARYCSIKSQSSSTFIKEKSRRLFKSIADFYYFIMAIIYRPHVPGCGGVAKNLATLVHVKNSRILDKVPSNASKKRFAAKLRKIRWRIYRDIDLKRGNIVKTLKYYKRQVRLFLKNFAKKLKSEEPSIWNEKVSKTSDDVYASKRNKKKVQLCASCSAKFVGSNGASLPSLPAAHHFARAKKTALHRVEKAKEENLDEKAVSAEVEAEYHDVEINEESRDDIAAIAQKENQLAEFWVNGSTNSVSADQAEELLLAISREAYSRVSKKSYVVMKAEEVTADDDENVKSAAAAAMASKEETDDEASAKTEIAVGSSRPTVFKPVDWTKCLK